MAKIVKTVHIQHNETAKAVSFFIPTKPEVVRSHVLEMLSLQTLS